jgi:hypothetical protein
VKHALVIGAFLWVGLSFASLAALAKYKSVPGPQGLPRVGWPAGSSIRRDPEKPTLLLFLHPRCPCSRASVEELIVILSRAPGRAAVHVAFYLPENEGEEWGDTDISRTVAGLPVAAFHWDREGREARIFGAATSGHVVVFDPDGGLRFSGGITEARGHLGDNPGRRAVIDLLLKGESDTPATPVYGCTILENTLE